MLCSIFGLFSKRVFNWCSVSCFFLKSILKSCSNSVWILYVSFNRFDEFLLRSSYVSSSRILFRFCSCIPRNSLFDSCNSLLVFAKSLSIFCLCFRFVFRISSCRVAISLAVFFSFSMRLCILCCKSCIFFWADIRFRVILISKSSSIFSLCIVSGLGVHELFAETNCGDDLWLCFCSVSFWLGVHELFAEANDDDGDAFV